MLVRPPFYISLFCTCEQPSLKLFISTLSLVSTLICLYIVFSCTKLFLLFLLSVSTLKLYAFLNSTLSSLHYTFLFLFRSNTRTWPSKFGILAARPAFVPTGDATSPILVYRPFSALFYAHSLDAIVFVVDSADYDRLSIARSELDVILNVSTRTSSLS